jgi:hypothetical protein
MRFVQRLLLVFAFQGGAQRASRAAIAFAGGPEPLGGRRRTVGAEDPAPRAAAAAAQPNAGEPRRRRGRGGRIRWAPPGSPSSTTTTALFVRNIDLPEAIIFYDTFERGDWSSLIKQCAECETAAIVVETGQGSLDPELDSRGRGAEGIALWVHGSAAPPNPKDVWDSLARVTIQPKPFGGSSGFGASQVVEPPRPPLPSRVVVIGPTEDHSQAARYAGMRAVSMDQADDLADAVVTAEDLQELWLEDIATPGSFWLNPPHPRDSSGNRVDPEQIISAMEPRGSDRTTPVQRMPGFGEPTDEDVKRILADISPL